MRDCGGNADLQSPSISPDRNVHQEDDKVKAEHKVKRSNSQATGTTTVNTIIINILYFIFNSGTIHVHHRFRALVIPNSISQPSSDIPPSVTSRELL
jgi:hypothetical protein